jgi:hypothetical protein
LDFVINNRSNDLIFGLCGANAVHMSMLQEYMARRIGVRVGTWYHLTANLHVYEQHYDLMDTYMEVKTLLPYPNSVPLVHHWPQFDIECAALCEGRRTDFVEPFMKDVAAPMARAWGHWKSGSEGGHHLANLECDNILAYDWHIACKGWIGRAKENRDAAAA